MKKDQDGIDPKLLWLTKGLSLTAYTGVIFLFPPLLTAKVMEIAERVTIKVIGDSLLVWAEDMVDGLVDELLGETS